MTKTDFSPGPWAASHSTNDPFPKRLDYEDRAENDVGFIHNGKRIVVEAVWYNTSDVGLHIREPDLRLIAAAPDLLDALEFVVRRLEEEGAYLSANEGQNIHYAWVRANEAIKAARNSDSPP